MLHTDYVTYVLLCVDVQDNFWVHYSLVRIVPAPRRSWCGCPGAPSGARSTMSYVPGREASVSFFAAAAQTRARNNRGGIWYTVGVRTWAGIHHAFISKKKLYLVRRRPRSKPVINSSHYAVVGDAGACSPWAVGSRTAAPAVRYSNVAT